jgi:hypothetical protein
MRHYFIIIAVTLLAACTVEGKDTAVNVCRMKWIEKFKPAFDHQQDVLDPGVQFVIACMRARGFKMAEANSCSGGQLVSASRCYNRNLSFEEWF